jgi:hypothetical protein
LPVKIEQVNNEPMLEAAINRFGGDALWRKLDYVLLDIESIGGPLPTIKGIGRTFPHFGRIQVFPKLFRSVFYDRNGSLLGEFDSGSVHQPGLPPVKNHRPSFDGAKKHRPWNTQDAIYFFGYAFTVYLSIPFLLAGLPIKARRLRNGGLRVDADFPNQIHSHCRKQSFYFDKSGLLVRHDYTAVIVGRTAWGAHFTSDYKEMDGLPVARQRHVYARLGSIATFIPVLSAKIEPAGIGFV